MRAITNILAGGAALAALACAAPASAQYYPGYPGYGNAYPYGAPMGGYGYQANSQAVVNQCANAVQARLGGYGGGYGYGYSYGAGGRVLGISQVGPRADGGITVRGVATSGRYGGYAYGSQSPDLVWRCRTDFRGYITEVTINRAQPNFGYDNYTPWNYDYSQYGYRRY
jgi:hypothetical protein